MSFSICNMIYYLKIIFWVIVSPALLVIFKKYKPIAILFFLILKVDCSVVSDEIIFPVTSNNSIRWVVFELVNAIVISLSEGLGKTSLMIAFLFNASTIPVTKQLETTLVVQVV